MEKTYKIDQESVNKLVELNNFLNRLEVRGAGNIEAMYSAMFLLKQVVEKIEELDKLKEVEA